MSCEAQQLRAANDTAAIGIVLHAFYCQLFVTLWRN